MEGGWVVGGREEGKEVSLKNISAALNLVFHFFQWKKYLKKYFIYNILKLGYTIMHNSNEAKLLCVKKLKKKL